MQFQMKSVLVVDDDEMVRLVATSYFEEWGFEVLEAENGQEALKLLSQNPELTLLFTDCRMPGMSGPELAHAATSHHPHLKVVLVSGYVDTITERAWPLVAKPFTENQLKRIVEAQLCG